MKVKVIVELVIEAEDIAAATHVVDAVLDAGTFQEELNAWNPPLEGDIAVESAVVTSADAVGGDSVDRIIVDLTDGEPATRCADDWWAWHDADPARQSPTYAESERRAVRWLEGDSDDGPTS